MIITPKIDYLEGYFDTKKVRMNCVTSKNRGRIDLCLESDDGFNIPIASIKLFSNDLFVDFIETFDDASKFVEEIVFRCNTIEKAKEKCDNFNRNNKCENVDYRILSNDGNNTYK